jgi:hypothetical protein
LSWCEPQSLFFQVDKAVRVAIAEATAKPGAPILVLGRAATRLSVRSHDAHAPGFRANGWAGCLRCRGVGWIRNACCANVTPLCKPIAAFYNSAGST